MSDQQNFTNNGQTANKNNTAGPEFGIQRIYTKDVSFEAPNTPQIFRDNWQPEVNLDLQSKSSRLEDNIYEVVICVTVTVKTNDKVAFIAEVHHAGIFTMRDFPSDQIQQMLGIFCPNIIFPYARERLTDLIVNGGFPQIYLAPINFDAVYQHQLQQKGKTNSPEQFAQSTGQGSIN